MQKKPNPFLSSSPVIESKKAARARASEAENKKGGLTLLGLKASDELRSKIEALKVSLYKETGRLPNTSDILRISVEEFATKRGI